MKYQSVVGLEIHIELKTNSKMFCSCRNNSEASIPNSEICPVCVGHPGTLPVINKEAVKKTIKTGLALNCKIPESSKFDRKNYFYPDLPKGYQISQYDKPFCKEGFLEMDPVRGSKVSLKAQRSLTSNGVDGKKIRITRVHLEEDTGKLIHPKGADHSLVDFNRAGIPLMELVTEPDLTSSQQARKFAEELRLILRYLNVSSADMEKGQLRVEVNISLQTGKKLGTKVEIKNLNSFRAVEKAIEYEIERQTDVLKSGKKVMQETRGWDETKGITVSQREKEEAHDYRYFPEPDLPTLHFSNDFIQEIQAEIPELPQQKRERMVEEYGLDKETANIFVVNRGLGEYFEKVMSELRNWVKEIEQKQEVREKEHKRLVKITSNYILTELQGLLKAKITADDETFPISPENFAEFIALIYEGKISSKIAKQVLEQMFKTGADPTHIIEEKDLSPITDQAEIEKIIKDIISKNQKAVDDYKKGKQTALQFLVGQVMAQTRGRANPDTVNQLLKKLLRR